jgi:hypothetical protein
VPQFAEWLRVERLIGRGAWGLVYAAHDARRERTVAVKVLRAEFTGSVSAERFRREIQILSRLHHPNIVPLYESGELAGAPWYSMPIVTGSSLRRRLGHERQLPIPEALRIARAVAEALAYAHAQNVVHRDITPGNILLQDGSVLVADFGIARAMTRSAIEPKISSSGLQIGTPTYMSPEQASGTDVDGRSDTYSLGCVLYEMLAGDPPFTGPANAVIAKHMKDPVPPLTTVRPSTPKSVAEVVYRALAKSPADRFASADEFARALAAVAEDPAVSVVAPPPRWRRARVALLAAAVAVVALVAAGSAWQARARAAEARAISATDTTRLAIFPLEGERGVDADAALRQAVLRWRGIDVVDPHRVAEAMSSMRDTGLSATRARELAIAMRAGRYLRGSLTHEGSLLRPQVMLFDVRNGDATLAEASAPAPVDRASLGAALSELTDRVLLRASLPADAGAATGTTSLPAMQAYYAGHRALGAWDLDAADTALAMATRLDPEFAQASVWLALTRIWGEKDSATWIHSAEAAASERARLSPGERARSDAALALAHGDRPRACAAWDAMTRSERFSFSAWYGAADCLMHDQQVLRDARSPSGWRFRSSHNAALARYRRAFELRPAVLRAWRANEYENVRQLLWTSGSSMRLGISSEAQERFFAAYPAWEGDSLSFTPFALSVLASSDPRALRRLPRTVDVAVRRQRELFVDIAAGWSSSEPRSATALHALAIALSMLGNASAIDTLMRAKSLATDPVERQRIVATEIWIRVQGALPGDRRELARARQLADSLLPTASAAPADPVVLASIAAITGHAFAAVRLGAAPAKISFAGTVAPVRALSRILELYAAFGGPNDSLLAIAARTDSSIAALESMEARAGARAEALDRAATLAFPSVTLPQLPSLASSGPYLLAADAALIRGDTLAVRRILANVQSERDAFALPELAIDAVYPEAWLLDATGDREGAAARLDPTLGRLRVTTLLDDPVEAAMLVRAMMFRADLASRMGDHRNAARWAGAVAILWSESDEFLQPIVQRARRLASDST